MPSDSDLDTSSSVQAAYQAVERIDRCDRNSCVFTPQFSECPSINFVEQTKPTVKEIKTEKENYYEISWNAIDQHNQISGVEDRIDITFEIVLSTKDGGRVCRTGDLQPVIGKNREKFPGKNYVFNIPKDLAQKYKISDITITPRRYCFDGTGNKFGRSQHYPALFN